MVSDSFFELDLEINNASISPSKGSDDDDDDDDDDRRDLIWGNREAVERTD